MRSSGANICPSFICFTVDRFPGDRRLSEEVEGLFIFSQQVIIGADVGQCDSLIAFQSGLTQERQRLLERFDGLSKLLLQFVNVADVGQQTGFSTAIREFPPQSQRPVESLHRPVMLTQ